MTLTWQPALCRKLLLQRHIRRSKLRRWRLLADLWLLHMEPGGHQRESRGLHEDRRYSMPDPP